MAREGSAVARIVGSVMNGLDMGEPGEVHQAHTEDRRTNGGAQALAQGGAAAGGVRGAAGDRHGASLSSDRVKRAHANPASRARRVQNSARPPRVCYWNDRAGLRACEGALERVIPTSVTFPCRWHSGSDASLAYRCGGSTGLVAGFEKSPGFTGFPFHPVKGTRNKMCRRAWSSDGSQIDRAPVALHLRGSSAQVEAKKGTRSMPRLPPQL